VLLLKGLIGGLLNVSFFAVGLLVPAGLVAGGTWRWHRALVFLGVYGVSLEATIVVLTVKAPESLEARLRRPVSKSQPVSDRILLAFLIVYFLAWLALIPVDRFHLRLLPRPTPPASWLGGVLVLFGFALMMAAIYQNSFATPIIEDQTERGQVVVDAGLYARVRHPMYLGALLFLAGIPLWLESYVALLATPVFLGILVARIGAEESTLQRTLPGYGEYIQKVRYRLLPLVW